MVIEIGLIQNFLLAFFVVVLLLGIGFFIVNIFKKEKPVKPVEEKPLAGYKRIIRKAHSHAKSLLFQTTIAAGNILSESKHTNEKVEQDLDQVLQSIAAKEIHAMKTATEQYQTEYQKHLENIQQQMDQNTKEDIERIQKSYNEKLEKFADTLLTNALSTQTIVDKKTAELLLQAENEIAEYKKTELEKVDQEVKNLIDKVYKDVLRVSIPQNLHEELILKSLEQAKKDEMFKL